MSVGSWQPEPQSLKALNLDQVRPLLDRLSTEDSSLDWVSGALDWVEPLVKAEKKAWLELASQLNSRELTALIRFFTLIEQHLNWDLSDKSPVIPLFKHLKKSEGVNRELVQWVKGHTDNKYLPFGPLL